MMDQILPGYRMVAVKKQEQAFAFRLSEAYKLHLKLSISYIECNTYNRHTIESERAIDCSVSVIDQGYKNSFHIWGGGDECILWLGKT
jgi:hypothetical protein